MTKTIFGIDAEPFPHSDMPRPAITGNDGGNIFPVFN